MNFIVTLMNDYTVRLVMLGTAILGMTTGIVGCFAFLRRQSLLGDAISHASLPGIAIMFLMTHSTSPYILLIGGACAGAIGTLLVMVITHKTTIKQDTALGIILSVFFGLGLVLLTYIQKKSIAHQAVLNKFLFGNASTLLLEDVIMIAWISSLLLFILFLFWKEFKLLAFDHSYAYCIGYKVFLLDCLVTALLVFAIVIGLQTVGVVLMSTMFIAPAAAARQWTSRFGLMFVLAGLFGAFSGIMGSVISSYGEHIPTGPVIIVIMSFWVLLSLVFAPHKGILWYYSTKKLPKDFYD